MRLFADPSQQPASRYDDATGVTTVALPEAPWSLEAVSPWAPGVLVRTSANEPCLEFYPVVEPGWLERLLVSRKK